uniref:Uncharacterized protein n=1 Tax=Plectus sambesii TaxID=2011161 RepID=A0A914X5P3_9BILA
MPQSAVWNYAAFALVMLDPFLNGIWFLLFRKVHSPTVFTQGHADVALWRTTVAMAFVTVAPVVLLLPIDLQYSDGFSWSLMGIGYLFALGIAVPFAVPVLHYSRSASICQYLEDRFESATLRRTVAVLNIVLITIYTTVLLAVSTHLASHLLPVSTLVLCPLLGYLSVFSVIFGGLNAATNANCYAPLLVTTAGLALLFGRGLSTHTIRLDVDFWHVRTDLVGGLAPFGHSAWALVLAGFLNSLHMLTSSPLVYHHYFAVTTRRRVQIAILIKGLLYLFIFALVIFWGAMLSYFLMQNCREEEHVDLFRKTWLAIKYFWDDAPGITGFVFAGLVWVGPATFASGLVSQATIVWEDMLRPHFTSFKEHRQLCTIQMSLFVIGTVAIVMATSSLCLVVDFHLYAKNALLFVAAVASPITAIYICGLFMPCSNAKGALVGLALGLAAVLTLSIGHLYFYQVSYPHYRPGGVNCSQSEPAFISTEAPIIPPTTAAAFDAFAVDSDTAFGVNSSAIDAIGLLFNASAIADADDDVVFDAANVMLLQSASATTADDDHEESSFALPFRLSIIIHPVIGFIVTLVTTFGVSVATGGQDMFAMDWNLVVCTCAGAVERLKVKRRDGNERRSRAPFVASDSFRYAQQGPLPDTNYANPKVKMYLADKETKT